MTNSGLVDTLYKLAAHFPFQPNLKKLNGEDLVNEEAGKVDLDHRRWQENLFEGLHLLTCSTVELLII